MKNNFQRNTLFDENPTANENIPLEKIKTTNVNILLNRVKLDEKKDTEKKNSFYFNNGFYFIRCGSFLYYYIAINLDI